MTQLKFKCENCGKITIINLVCKCHNKNKLEILNNENKEV